MSAYEDDMLPLMGAIDVVFNNYVKSDIKIYFEKYRGSFLKNQGSRDELINDIKPRILLVKEIISPIYYKKVILKYFSEKGFILFVADQLLVQIQKSTDSTVDKTN